MDMRQKRRVRKDHGGLLALAIMILVFGGVAFLIASPPSSHTAVQSNPGEDAFYGKITNVPFQGRTTGAVKADTNCKMVQNGLTNCIGIIMAEDGTELHFDYTHDMSNQPCLSQGEHVTITLLGDGTVKVVRG